ncbi:MAG: hypothetical protein F4Y82_05330 [Cenarchaeum sp. SB0665_bin_23]|nr:hypothetical protein [Cenarchaeum sp. SB0667_bin_13]MXY61514.1 hypothetical protein [Cenarchaeum sp. SB0665_bin_23]MXZ93173.1 hypothetical protein [Cenarchaeum sp. SB0666_bin_15]MYC80193.1 hypothetical protein [Cenarchaeum sp. SB0661_bin_35]MYD58145.1 hypothetical protein [Cenarchaeum sp. SB0678_bin_8]MYG32589.1 hypothetical protein [Cenarchaeum sp. SB0677_bin_16]MYI51581.1 hypothetical protein [Cenarchaeum sp. SB0673_bin_9]MYJ27862.1 hypothetical protein [Cenarchaeum sp. SB0672_bin_9]
MDEIQSKYGNNCGLLYQHKPLVWALYLCVGDLSVVKGHNRASKRCTANTHNKGYLGVDGSTCPATTSVMVI